MKKTQIVSVLAVFALILNLGLFIEVKRASAQAPQTLCINLTRSLSMGSKDSSSKDVTSLQNFLYSNGYLSIPATGYFGKMTQVAVKNFQAREGLAPVGVVGPMTRGKISTLTCLGTLPPAPTTPVPVQPSTSTPMTPVSKTIKLPYTLSNFSDFKTIWGDTSIIENKTLLVKAGTTTNGAQIILENSNDLVNYKILANIFARQATITLISRYADENNFVACTFAGRYVEIVERKDGNSKVVASATVEYFPSSNFFYNDLNLSMRVQNKTVGCSLIGNEDNVSYNNLDEKLSKGGVGIQTWANSVNIANIELRGVKIDQI